METMLLRLHQGQIRHQCHAALLAIQIANQGLSQNDHEIFWASIQNFLTATANISKALWGSSGRLKDARQPLRDSLAIDENNPLSSTNLRNHLEHFDERLDRWYQTSTSHNYADFIIGPKATTVSGLTESDMFRQFDPETNEVIFWGEFHPIQPLVDAVSALLPVAERESRKPHWPS